MICTAHHILCGCHIVNDTAAQIMPYLESDVRIVVNAVDYDRARQLLDTRFDGREFVTREKNGQ